MTFDAVIVAAGSSTRFGAADKLSADLCGKPVLAWSRSLFESLPGVGCLVVVAAPGRVEEFTAMAREWCPTAAYRIVPGGARRRDSVEAGLRECTARYVAIHDGARPLATPELVARVLAATEGRHRIT